MYELLSGLNDVLGFVKDNGGDGKDGQDERSDFQNMHLPRRLFI
jgi:hypothetical protein